MAFTLAVSVALLRASVQAWAMQRTAASNSRVGVLQCIVVRLWVSVSVNCKLETEDAGHWAGFYPRVRSFPDPNVTRRQTP